jgi:hypothetical protein
VLTAERAIVGFDVSLANLELVTLFRTALARANGTGGPALVDTHSFFVAPLDGSPAELLNHTPGSVEPR